MTLGGRLLRALQGARDPLLGEAFKAGDEIAQCPRSKHWMLVSSWERMGKCAGCDYKLTGADLVDLRRRPVADRVDLRGGHVTDRVDLRGGHVTDRVDLQRLPVRWQRVLVGLLVALLICGLVYLASTRPHVGETVATYDKWQMVEIRGAATTQADYCRVRTPSQRTTSHWMMLRVTPKSGVTPEFDPPYSWDQPVLLRIDQAEQPYDLASGTQSLLTVIEWFKRGRTAYVSGSSSTGDQIYDSYSLDGFQDAYGAALSSCWNGR